MGTITYTGTLVTTTCWCGIHLAVPNDLYDYAQRHGQHICCPLGHEFVFTDTVRKDLEKAREELAAERRRLAATRDLLAHEERSHAATRGHVTRKRRELTRVKAGVCPCCNRTFQNLARHMEGQHPEFHP